MRNDNWFVTKDFVWNARVFYTEPENEEIDLLEALFESMIKRSHIAEYAEAAEILKRIIEKIK